MPYFSNSETGICYYYEIIPNTNINASFVVDEDGQIVGGGITEMQEVDCNSINE